MSGERYALIVASDTHDDPRLRQLRAPAADAEELARVLRDPQIGAFEVDTSHNEAEHVVRRRLSAFFENRGIDDLLLLHLSCHGVKDEDGRLYFATSDTEVDHLDATSIPADFVNRQMTRCRSRRIVLLLDCCYSGAFARGMVGRAGDRVDIKERFEGRGRIVLTASSAMEYSFEGDLTSGEGRPSVFTSAVVQGLATGEADRDRDGFVSVDELYEFAYEQVRTVTPSQTPGKWVFDLQGDFYLARSAAGVPTVVPGLPPELGLAMVSPFARVRRGAVEELGGLLGHPDEALAAAAREALLELTRDDSNDVSQAARRYVFGPEEPQPTTGSTDVGESSSADSSGGSTQDAADQQDAAAPAPAAARFPPKPLGLVGEVPLPRWVPATCRGAAMALLGGAALPLMISDTMTRWNTFAVMAPIEMVLSAVLLWLIANGVTSRQVQTGFAAGVLIGIGTLTTAGALGLVGFTAEWGGPLAVLCSVLSLLGAVAAGLCGLASWRASAVGPAAGRSERTPAILAVLGAVLTIGALFVPYDGESSLWIEIEEGVSAAFAYLPVVAVLLMIVAILLLGSRRLFAAGTLGATGALTAAHFVGLLLAATFAVGEVGGVQPGWALGVAGGVLAAVAGWQAAVRSGQVGRALESA